MTTAGKNSSYLRQLNKKSIINIIRNEKVSRAEISRITGLTKPAVSAIVDHLIQTGFVKEVGIEEIYRGRHPEMLSLNASSFYAVGVNIYRDKCIMGFSDFSGKIIKSCNIDINGIPPVIAVNIICKKIMETQEELQIPSDKILGIGISIPGPVNTINGQVLNPPNFELWHNFNIVEQFKKVIDIQTFVENDATAYALLENLIGYGKDFSNYLMLVLVDGVGSAEILEGVPFRGQYGLNSEIGHVSIDINGNLCSCGNNGCLELYTSIPIVVANAKAKGLPVDSWEDIVDLALDQNPDCLAIIKDEAKYLSFAISNIVNIFAPEAVILSGKIQYKPDLLLSLIKNEVYAKYSKKRLFEPQVLMSKLKHDTETIAATAIVLNDFFFTN
ncbi:MAG: ROK family transcriptional regulator [Saccharofermentanales bacterium]